VAGLGSLVSELPDQSGRSPPHTSVDLYWSRIEAFRTNYLRCLRDWIQGRRREENAVYSTPGRAPRRLTMCGCNPSEAHRFRRGYPGLRSENKGCRTCVPIGKVAPPGGLDARCAFACCGRFAEPPAFHSDSPIQMVWSVCTTTRVGLSRTARISTGAARPSFIKQGRRSGPPVSCRVNRSWSTDKPRCWPIQQECRCRSSWDCRP
jgi:hypothetical protein